MTTGLDMTLAATPALDKSGQIFDRLLESEPAKPGLGSPAHAAARSLPWRRLPGFCRVSLVAGRIGANSPWVQANALRRVPTLRMAFAQDRTRPARALKPGMGLAYCTPGRGGAEFRDGDESGRKLGRYPGRAGRSAGARLRRRVRPCFLRRRGRIARGRHEPQSRAWGSPCRGGAARSRYPGRAGRSALGWQMTPRADESRPCQAMRYRGRIARGQHEPQSRAWGSPCVAARLGALSWPGWQIGAAPVHREAHQPTSPGPACVRPSQQDRTRPARAPRPGMGTQMHILMKDIDLAKAGRAEKVEPGRPRSWLLTHDLSGSSKLKNGRGRRELRARASARRTQQLTLEYGTGGRDAAVVAVMAALLGRAIPPGLASRHMAADMTCSPTIPGPALPNRRRTARASTGPKAGHRALSLWCRLRISTSAQSAPSGVQCRT